MRLAIRASYQKERSWYRTVTEGEHVYSPRSAMFLVGAF
jgi:hypothetical protein